MSDFEEMGSLKYSLTFSPPLKRTVLSEIPEVGFLGGSGVRVAVIDSGVNTSVSVFDQVDLTGFGTHDGIKVGHGTHVATIIKHFAKNSEIINIKATQTKDKIDFVNVLNGLAYARDHGAHIVNLSLGGHKKNHVCNGKCIICREVQAFAEKTGMIIISAAGNEGPNEGTINCPSAAPDVISVGMTNVHGSAVGEISSRSTPGMVKPNLLTSGTIALDALDASGTSFATPVISGIIAASLPVFKFNTYRLLACLYNSCEEIPSVPKHHQGHGVFNIRKYMEEIKREKAIVDRQGQSPS